jgi:hypothetical protein
MNLRVECISFYFAVFLKELRGQRRPEWIVTTKDTKYTKE